MIVLFPWIAQQRDPCIYDCTSFQFPKIQKFQTTMFGYLLRRSTQTSTQHIIVLQYIQKRIRRIMVRYLKNSKSLPFLNNLTFQNRSPTEQRERNEGVRGKWFATCLVLLQRCPRFNLNGHGNIHESVAHWKIRNSNEVADTRFKFGCWRNFCPVLLGARFHFVCIFLNRKISLNWMYAIVWNCWVIWSCTEKNLDDVYKGMRRRMKTDHRRRRKRRSCCVTRKALRVGRLVWVYWELMSHVSQKVWVGLLSLYHRKAALLVRSVLSHLRATCRESHDGEHHCCLLI